MLPGEPGHVTGESGRCSVQTGHAGRGRVPVDRGDLQNIREKAALKGLQQEFLQRGVFVRRHAHPPRHRPHCCTLRATLRGVSRHHHINSNFELSL